MLGMDARDIFHAIRTGDTTKTELIFREHPEWIELRNPDCQVEGSQSWDELKPIHTAAKFGHLGIVKLLVELGAEVYSHPLASYPAVILADWAGHKNVVDYFLKEIPDKAEGTLQLGITCNLAGRQGWFDLVKAHIERDPLAVHQRGWIGDTPLHWPAHNGYISIVKLLLDHGADPNAQEVNWIGGTPLHWASECHADIVTLLIQAGARVNERVERPGSHHLGGTPLIWCARQRDDSGEVAKTLLEAGADASLKDSHGKTARDWAQERNNARIMAVLTKHDRV